MHDLNNENKFKFISLFLFLITILGLLVFFLQISIGFPSIIFVHILITQDFLVIFFSPLLFYILYLIRKSFDSTFSKKKIYTKFTILIIFILILLIIMNIVVNLYLIHLYNNYSYSSLLTDANIEILFYRASIIDLFSNLIIFKIIVYILFVLIFLRENKSFEEKSAIIKRTKFRLKLWSVFYVLASLLHIFMLRAQYSLESSNYQDYISGNPLWAEDGLFTGIFIMLILLPVIIMIFIQYFIQIATFVSLTWLSSTGEKIKEKAEKEQERSFNQFLKSERLLTKKEMDRDL